MKKIRLYSFLVATFMVLLGFVIQLKLQCQTYKTAVNNSYIKSIDELSENISNIETSLTKSMYSNTTPEQIKMLTKLGKESVIAKESISNLPLSDVQLSKLNLFITQLDDYSLYLLQNLSKGNIISEKDKQALSSLLNYSQQLDESLQYIRMLFENSDINFQASEDEYNEISENSEDIELLSVTDGLKLIEQDFSDFPKLIYDGPFSDNIMNKKSVFLQNKEQVSVDEAQQKAASLLAVKKGDLQYLGENNGNLENYYFQYDNASISITKSGAYLESIIKPYTCASVNLSCEEAAASALDFMKNIGIDNMVQTYYSSENGICTVNFAYCENEIIYYSDLIKISVEQENGTMVSFCATNYLMNHHERNKAQNKISLELAKSSLNSELTVNAWQEVFIPNSSSTDVQCYEFKCSSSDRQDIIVYINVETGLEEDILVLLKHDGGTLVM